MTSNQRTTTESLHWYYGRMGRAARWDWDASGGREIYRLYVPNECVGAVLTRDEAIAWVDRRAEEDISHAVEWGINPDMLEADKDIEQRYIDWARLTPEESEQQRQLMKMAPPHRRRNR